MTRKRDVYLASQWSSKPFDHCQSPVEWELQCWQAQLSSPCPEQMEQREDQLGGQESHWIGWRSSWRGSSEGEKQPCSVPSCDRGPPRRPKMTVG